MLELLIHLIVLVLVITLHVAMYMWTTELEKENCDCSDLLHRNLINIFSILLLILIPVNFYLRYKNFLPIKSFNLDLKTGYSIIVGGIGVFYMVIILDYVMKLKEKNCECSEDWKREYGYIFTIVYISILLLMLLLIIIMGIIGGILIMMSKSESKSVSNKTISKSASKSLSKSKK